MDTWKAIIQIKAIAVKIVGRKSPDAAQSLDEAARFQRALLAEIEEQYMQDRKRQNVLDISSRLVTFRISAPSEIGTVSSDNREVPGYPLMKQWIIESARVVGITIDPYHLERQDEQELAGDELEDDEQGTETPQSIFQSVFDNIALAEAAMHGRPTTELGFARAAAVSASEAVERLRGLHRLFPLAQLEQSETALWERVRTLEKQRGPSRTPG